MSWFGGKKKTLSSREVSEVTKSLFVNEADEIKNKFIQLAVESLTSTGMSPDEKVDIFNRVCENLYEAYNDSYTSDLKQIADRSYSFLTTYCTADYRLLKRIQKRYDDFKSLPDDSVAEDFGFQDIMRFSNDMTEYLSIEHDEESFVVTCKYSLAGLDYRDKHEKEATLSLIEDDTVILEREPDNKYDSNAIKILTLSGIQIGYVEKTVSKYMTDNFSDIIETIISEIYGEYSEDSTPDIFLSTILEKKNI